MLDYFGVIINLLILLFVFRALVLGLALVLMQAIVSLVLSFLFSCYCSLGPRYGSYPSPRVC